MNLRNEPIMLKNKILCSRVSQLCVLLRCLITKITKFEKYVFLLYVSYEPPLVWKVFHISRSLNVATWPFRLKHHRAPIPINPRGFHWGSGVGFIQASSSTPDSLNHVFMDLTFFMAPGHCLDEKLASIYLKRLF